MRIYGDSRVKPHKWIHSSYNISLKIHKNTPKSNGNPTIYPQIFSGFVTGCMLFRPSVHPFIQLLIDSDGWENLYAETCEAIWRMTQWDKSVTKSWLHYTFNDTFQHKFRYVFSVLVITIFLIFRLDRSDARCWNMFVYLYSAVARASRVVWWQHK